MMHEGFSAVQLKFDVINMLVYVFNTDSHRHITDLNQAAKKVPVHAATARIAWPGPGTLFRPCITRINIQ